MRMLVAFAAAIIEWSETWTELNFLLIVAALVLLNLLLRDD